MMCACRNQHYLLNRKSTVQTKNEETNKLMQKVISGVLKKHFPNRIDKIRVDILLSTLEENKGILKRAIYIDSDSLKPEDAECLEEVMEQSLNRIFDGKDLLALRQTKIADKWGDVTIILNQR